MRRLVSGKSWQEIEERLTLYVLTSASDGPPASMPAADSPDRCAEPESAAADKSAAAGGEQLNAGAV